MGVADIGGWRSASGGQYEGFAQDARRHTAENSRLYRAVDAFLNGCQVILISVHGFERGHKIVDAAELAINRGETDVGNFADQLQFDQYQFADFSTADVFS